MYANRRCTRSRISDNSAIAKADWNAMDADYEAAVGKEPLASREG
jgi:hypothetical protein